PRPEDFELWLPRHAGRSPRWPNITATAGDQLETAIRLGCAAIHLPVSTLNAALVDAAHAAGLRVNTWTVNTAENVCPIAEAGVDEITTDFPAMARQALGFAR